MLGTMQRFCSHDVCSQRLQGTNINMMILGHRSLPGNLFKAIPFGYVDIFEANHIKVQNYGNSVDGENAPKVKRTELCIARLPLLGSNEQWYRVIVMDKHFDTSCVYSIDYGVLTNVKNSSIRVKVM